MGSCKSSHKSQKTATRVGLESKSPDSSLHLCHKVKTVIRLKSVFKPYEFNIIIIYFNFQPLLPSSLTTADASQILQQFMKGKRGLGAKVFCESIVCSEKFVESCRTMFDPLMKKKAEKVCFQMFCFVFVLFCFVFGLFFCFLFVCLFFVLFCFFVFVFVLFVCLFVCFVWFLERKWEEEVILQVDLCTARLSDLVNHILSEV